MEYIRTELGEGALYPTVAALGTVFYAWSSIALLFRLRKKPKEIGGLPLLMTMGKVLEIFRRFKEQNWPNWHYGVYPVLGVFSALICPALGGDCEGKKLSFLYYRVVQLMDPRGE